MEYLLTGLGLSGSAGLNAYLPLLIMGVMHHLGWMKLTDKYEPLASYPVLGVVIVLLIIEMVADKIPAVDSVNDVIQTFVRPATGTLLFAASSANLEQVDPTAMFILSLLAGGGSAGGVHLVKATVRPGITLTTGGMGNMVISLAEDIVSFCVSTFAILIPFVVVIFSLSLVVIICWWGWDRARTRLYFGEKPKRSPEIPFG